MLNLTQFIPLFHMAVVAFLPLIVALLAGVIRQDGLPPSVNEIISYIVVVAVGIVQALADGKLGGSPQADFLIVVAYSQAALHSPLLQKFQCYLQGNVLNVLKPPSAPAVAAAPAVDYTAIAQIAFDLLKKNAPQIAQLVGVELSKQFTAPPVKASQPATSNYPYPGGFLNSSNLGVASHVDELPTNNGLSVVPPAIRVNTPYPTPPNKAG